jgi:hypothetical protein
MNRVLDEADIKRLEYRWRKAMQHPQRIKVLTPLPHRTRLRLAIHRVITNVGIWLGDHVSWTAAERLWHVTGQWNRKR